jgi:hypothetical protein
MRLRFDPGDDDAYYATRDALLDELDGWLDRPARERAGVVTDVDFLLNWRYHDSSGVLDEFTPRDVTEFLLEWCPRRLKGHPDAAAHLCFAVGVYVDFMAATGRLVGGAERAGRLRRLVDDIAPTVLAETRSQAPVVDLAEAGRYELPFVYVPPPAADVAAAAAAVPLLVKIDALQGYLGSEGKPLTAKGNLKLADGRALVELLDTGDEMDPQIGDKTFRTGTTANLMRLNSILDIAKGAGAVRVHDRRLVSVKGWQARATLPRAEAVFAAIVRLGPLGLQSSAGISYFNDLNALLDKGTVHWLAPLLAPETAELPFESFSVWARSVASRQMARDWPHGAELLAEFTDQGMSRMFEVLEDAGVVRWTDREEVPQRYGRSYWGGGTLVLTALGRHVLPDYVDAAGYVMARQPVCNE